MGMSNLVPEVRVNKNGVPVTKHVNPTVSSNNKIVFPTPSVSSAAPNIAIISDALKVRLEKNEFSGFTDYRKIMVIKKLAGLRKETLEYLEPTFTGNHYDRVQIESALIELLDRGIAPVKVDDVIHVLRDFEDPGYFEMWEESRLEHTPWGKYLVNTLENHVLKNMDDMEIKGLEYRYNDEDRVPLRLQQGTDAERAKAVIGLLVNARGANTELTELRSYVPSESRVTKSRSAAFSRMFSAMDDYNHQELFKFLMTDYFRDGLPYLKDEANAGSVVRMLMSSKDAGWSMDWEAYAELSEIGLNSDYVMSEEAVDQMYIDIQNDLFHGRLVALAEKYPDEIDAVVNFINERGKEIPEAGSEALIAYLGHEVAPLRNGAL
jgi:hypothetical protein